MSCGPSSAGDNTEDLPPWPLLGFSLGNQVTDQAGLGPGRWGGSPGACPTVRPSVVFREEQRQIMSLVQCGPIKSPLLTD